eukprot:4407228-Amphidinium_carterae.1
MAPEASQGAPAPEAGQKGKGKAKGKGKKVAIVKLASAPPATSTSGEDAEVTQQVHQQFNQFLKYHKKATKSQKHKDVVHLGELYDGLSSANEKKAFIKRWHKAGGSQQHN